MAFRFLVILFFVLSQSIITAQVTADFIHDFDPNTNNSCAPISISFTNTSTNANSYSWTLDGNVFSTTTSPQRSFAIGGSFQICLDATDGSSSDQKCETININDPAAISIGATNAISCAPLNALVDIVSSKVVSSATIDYGDGIIDVISPNSTTFTGSHTYTQEGIYSITVSVVDDDGCSSTSTSANLFTVQNINDLGFSINLSSCVVPLTATFTNITPNPGNYNFLWDFGDGNTAATVNASHNYSISGSYNVSLTATDVTTGCSETFTINDAINSQSAVNILANEISSGNCSEKEVDFSFDNLPTGASVIWDFGDGTGGNGETITHTYTTAGCYTPVAQITTTAGCIFTISAVNCIQSIGPNDPSFSMSGDTETCNAVLGTSIQFNSNSNLATGWLWDFGDGNTSSSENPLHTYTGFGTYSPSLTTTYTNGCSQTYSDTALVVIIQEPSLTIVADSTRGCIPMDVNFQINGSNDPIASIDWDFGFTTSTINNPAITYATIGDFTVDANVTTTTGCVINVQAIDLIEVGDVPNVFFAVDTFASCVDTPINFTDLSDPTVDEWEWVFGDGGTSQDPNPVHNYLIADSFQVSLTAYYNGCPNTYEETNYINIAEPRARFAWGYQCGVDNTINFTDLSTGADSIWWDFGDGSPMIAATNPTHLYAAEGSYTITQFVKNHTTECTDDETIVVTVLNPVADFQFTKNAVCLGDTLTLTNLSIGIADVTWTLPPGVIAVDDGDNGEDARFVFTQPGFFSGYIASYTTTSGCSDFISFSDLITVSYLFPSFTYDVTNCLPAQLNITNNSVDIFNYATTYTWEIGDSVYNVSTPIHTFDNIGTYEINLTMQDTVGCSVSIANPEIVTVEIPVPDFEWELTDCTSKEITFSNISSGSNISGFNWDFGDGNSSNVANPIHTYSANGDYSVVFTVTSSTGCVESITKVIQVYDPIASFTGDNLSKSCPNPALITNFSNTTQGGSSWRWEFGDGGTSSLENPSHAYGAIDTFDVMLIATSVNGCVDTFTRQDYIEVGGPFASFNYSTNQSCIGADIEFIVSGNGVIDYTWDFGDGNAQNSTPSGISDTLIYSYSAPGSYLPTLIAKDATGCRVPYVGTDSLVISNLSADFVADLTAICENSGTRISFTSLISNPGLIDSVRWYFPGSDINTSTDLDVSNVSYTAVGQYDVSLVVFSSVCSDSITKTNYIEVQGPPSFTMPNDASICEGSATSLVITNGSGLIYSWDTNDPGLSCYNCDNPTASPTTTTTYTVIGTNAGGCSTSGTVTVTVDSASSDLISEFEQVCINDIISLNISGVSNVLWTSTLPISCTTCNNPDITANGNGVVTLNYTYLSCNITETLTISVWDPSTVDAGPDQSVCSGGVVNLNRAFPGTVNWYADDLSSTPISGNTVNPTIDTKYYLEVSNYGCTALDSFQVLIDVPVITTSGDITICLGLSTQISVTGDPGNTYVWDTNDPGLSCYNCDNPIANPSVNTTYTVTATNTNGCSTTESITVSVNDTGSDLIGDEMAVCQNEMIPFNVSGVSNVTWSSTLPISCSSCTDPVVTAIADGTVTVSYEYLQCIFTESMSITIWDPSSVDAGPNQTVCSGQEVVLESNYPGSIQWFENSLSSPAISGFQVYPAAPTRYYVEVSNNGCIGIDSFDVTIDVPAINISNNTTICIGSFTQLSVGGGIDYDYAWDTSLPGLSCYDCPNPDANPTIATTYVVTVTNTNGCTNSASVTVNVDNVTNDELPSELMVCVNEVIPIQISNNASNIQWNSTLPISCVTCPDPNITADQNGTATISYRYLTCDISEVVNIEVWDPTTVDAGNDTIICDGTMIPLNSSYPGVFEWFENDLNSTALSNRNVTPGQSTKYYLTVDNHGCQALDSINIDVLANANIIGGSYEICEGEEIELDVVGDADTLRWNNAGSLSSSNSFTTIANPTNTTTYTIVAGNNGCAEDTATVHVEVFEAPTVEIRAPETFIDGTTIQLVANVTDSDLTYAWSPAADLDCSDCRLPQATPTATTTYQVIVTNEDGCSAVDTTTIIQKFICGDEPIGVPSAFSPNGDGINDLVNPVSLNTISKFQIFNRWGELVHESDGNTSGWDGKYKGQLVPKGIYVYFAEGTCRFDGSPLLVSGEFALIR